MHGQNILERLQDSYDELPRSSAKAVSKPVPNNHWLQEKQRLQNDFIELLDISFFTNINSEELDDLLIPKIADFVSKEIQSEFSEQAERMAKEIYSQFAGLGPLEPLFNDKSISEIMVNGTDTLYIEKNGKIQESEIRFMNEKHIRIIIEQIVGGIGRYIDEKKPMVDARLPDGSRVNIIIPPAALRGSTITIRRFLHNKLNTDDLVKLGTASTEMISFLKSAVEGSLNIMISGRTGSGKTTFLNLISSFIPSDERIVTIEDAAEVSLQQKHVITLESIPPDRKGENEVAIRDLVKNALRMRPDRIIVGECRGNEAFDMLQAMNTGHDGSMSTVHANSPRDALDRIGSLFVMAGYDIPNNVIRQHIASALDLIIQIDRLPDGSRKVTQITEITGMEGEMITMQDIYDLEWKMDDNGKVIAHHKGTGIRPQCATKLENLGLSLPEFVESATESASKSQIDSVSNHQSFSDEETFLKTR
jgi:pilus assembly protein CpaF